MKNLQDECLDRLGGTKFSPTPMIVFHMTSLLDGRVRETFSYVVLDRDHRFDKIMKNHCLGLPTEKKNCHCILPFFAGPQLFSCAFKDATLIAWPMLAWTTREIAEGYALTSWHSVQRPQTKEKTWT